MRELDVRAIIKRINRGLLDDSSLFNVYGEDEGENVEKAKDLSKLVKIQKQVTKKGKTYMQTFWVKPEEAEEEEKKPKIPEVEEKKEKEEKVEGEQKSKLDWKNNPFFENSVDEPRDLDESEIPKKVAMSLGGEEKTKEKILVLPEKYIAGGFQFGKYCFVVHAMVTIKGSEGVEVNPKEFRVTELSTGFSIGVTNVHAGTALETGKEKLKSLGLKAVTKAVEKSPNIKPAATMERFEGTIYEKKVWGKKELKSVVEEIDSYIHEATINVQGGVSGEKIEDWINEHYENPETFEEVKNLKEIGLGGVSKADMITAVVMLNVPVDNVIDAVEGIQKLASSVQKMQGLTGEGKDYDDILVDVLNWMVNTNADLDYDDVSTAEAAMAMKVSYKDYETQVEESESESDEDGDEESEGDKSIGDEDEMAPKDAFPEGDYKFTESVKDWVSGSVRDVRMFMKVELDDTVSAPGETYNETYGGMAKTFDKYSHPLDYLNDMWRGTGSKEIPPGVVVGSRIPFGCGSFSKDLKRGTSFAAHGSGGSGVVIHLGKIALKETKGIDVDAMNYWGISTHDGYSEEREVIVRGVYLVVDSIESRGGRRFVEAHFEKEEAAAKALKEKGEAEKWLDDIFDKPMRTGKNKEPELDFGNEE